jgi:hypothetical protein
LPGANVPVTDTLTVHKAILLAHAGACPPRKEALHEDDDPFDNRYPLKLYYGTHTANEAQKHINARRRRAAATPGPPSRWRRLTAWLRRR